MVNMIPIVVSEEKNNAENAADKPVPFKMKHFFDDYF